MRVIKYILISLILFSSLLFSCKLKTKTELYLERDLDILSNKKEVNFSFNDDIEIEEIAVIRDKKENKKTLVLKLENSTVQKNFLNCLFKITAKIEQEDGAKRIDEWEFEPIITVAGENRYILKQINIKEDKIQKFTIQLVKNNEKLNDKALIVKNLYTYND